MNNSKFQKLKYVLLLILSPFILLSIFGIVYIIIKMITGLGLFSAVSSFTTLLAGLVPYFPYLTTIPAIFILLVLVIKKMGRVKQNTK